MMTRIAKIQGIFVCLAVFAVIAILALKLLSTKEYSWQRDKLILRQKIASLEDENNRLAQEIKNLSDQNLSLKTYLDAYEHNVIELKDAARNCCQPDSIPPAELIPGLADESLENRHLYRVMLAEKKHWDQYQQEQYQQVLDGTVEPALYEIQRLVFVNEDVREQFLELEAGLKLHQRLIRDVRLFHDEILFQQKQHQDHRDYELYDLKFKLAPFARESALVDALQQAMSALSAGIYQGEAVAVLDRIGDEFTRPIRQLYEQQGADDYSDPIKYNFNLYALYGKKLMAYSDSLARQTSIPLGPAAFGELDFFNRRLAERFYDLHQVAQNGVIDSSVLDLDELELVLDSH